MARRRKKTTKKKAPSRQTGANNSGQPRYTPKQIKFCHEYVKSFQAYPAAKKAGYSESYARTHSHKLVQQLSDKILELQNRQSGQLSISAMSIKRELALIGFANIQDYYEDDPITEGAIRLKPLDRLTRDQAAAIVEVKVTKQKNGTIEYWYKLADKRGALVDLAKILGMLNDKLMMIYRERERERVIHLRNVPTEILERIERMYLEHGQPITVEGEAVPVLEAPKK